MAKRFNGLPAMVRPGADKTRLRFVIVVDVECESEDLPIRGNCQASGDADQDEQQAKWIEHQLANGNPWAWCSVKVTAEIDGHSGSDYLGGCSYYDGADFCQGGSYFDDMVSEAVEQALAARAKAQGA